MSKAADFHSPKGRTDLPREEYELEITAMIKLLDIDGLLRVIAYIKRIW